MVGFISLPQITKPSLEHFLTKEEYNEKQLLSITENGSGYQIETTIENLAPVNSRDIFDEKFIYYEPFGTPFRDKQAFLNFRSRIVALANEFGFPSLVNIDVRKFDQTLARILWSEGSEIQLNVLNASKEGTWNYLQGIILLDVVAWRWISDGDKKTFNKDRLTSIGRGALSSAWWRYNILTNNGQSDYEDWMDLLTQDDVVQIIERTRMRGYTPIIIPYARRIADIRKEQNEGKIVGKKANDLIRASAKRIRTYVGTRNSWYLKQKDTDFELLVDEIFTEAEKMLD